MLMMNDCGMDEVAIYARSVVRVIKIVMDGAQLSHVKALAQKVLKDLTDVWVEIDTRRIEDSEIARTEMLKIDPLVDLITIREKRKEIKTKREVAEMA
jgi:hypothetical protein